MSILELKNSTMKVEKVFSNLQNWWCLGAVTGRMSGYGEYYPTERPGARVCSALLETHVRESSIPSLMMMMSRVTKPCLWSSWRFDLILPKLCHIRLRSVLSSYCRNCSSSCIFGDKIGGKSNFVKWRWCWHRLSAYGFFSWRRLRL